MGTSKTVLILSTFAAFTVAYWYNVCNKQRKEAFYIAKQIDKTTINDTLFKLSLETDRAFPEPPKSPYHVIVKDDRTQIYRLYTPLLIDGRRVELIVRVYRNGIVSNILNSLERGDAIHISSPKPTQIYEPNTVSTLVMIAGGTGALPFYQLSKRILEDPVDKTSLFLIWVCGMENDFFLKEELNELSRKYPERFRFSLMNTGATKVKDGSSDATRRKLYEDHLRSLIDVGQSDGENGIYAIVCGPAGFRKVLIGSNDDCGVLGTIGYRKSQIGSLWEGDF